MSAISLIQPDRDLFSWPQYWAACFGPAPFLPMSREEMDQLGWDSCDIILVTGDAYVDHPSFGMAICGRMLEAQGFRVGIISQPDWNSKDDFMRLGKPNLFFGVTAGNMDSMINRYTPTVSCAMTMLTPPATWRVNARTAPPWSTPSAVKRRGKTCR
ncbi:radical SAM domain-containing protein [Klebsiella variicola]|uniref:Radical SAM domain-containing protein n=1 Tax=Klebsiella variicola TaxID=244366 RepID=A0A7H4MSE0_KLEVA|nr:radical SAM domain-containing protein [Klebsiella variicola]